MTKRVSWQQQFKAEEAKVNVSVLDTAQSDQPCPCCGQPRLVFYVHLFREEHRPIAALCKDCAMKRAGGEEKVYIKEAPGPWLRKRWEADKAVPKLSAAQLAAARQALTKARKNG